MNYNKLSTYFGLQFDTCRPIFRHPSVPYFDTFRLPIWHILARGLMIHLAPSLTHFGSQFNTYHPHPRLTPLSRAATQFECYSLNILILNHIQYIYIYIYMIEHESISVALCCALSFLFKSLQLICRSEPRFDINMSSYQYEKSHCGDKTVVRSSYLHNGISYTCKMTSLYRFSPQLPIDLIYGHMISRSVAVTWINNKVPV